MPASSTTAMACWYWPTCTAPPRAISDCRWPRSGSVCAACRGSTCRCCCAYSTMRTSRWTNWWKSPPAGAAEESSSTMLEKEIVVSNRLGLHARASAKLVQLVQGFKSTVWLVSKGREVNAQSIMGVMMLAAGIGTALTVRTDGPDEQTALDAVVDLFERKFDEGG